MIMGLIPPYSVFPEFYVYSVFRPCPRYGCGCLNRGLRHHVEITGVGKISVESGAVKDRKERLYVGEGHFNSKGNQIAAQAIITQLAKCGFIKLPEKALKS
jgi:hypothetical protein